MGTTNAVQHGYEFLYIKQRIEAILNEYCRSQELKYLALTQTHLRKGESSLLLCNIHSIQIAVSEIVDVLSK